MSTGFTRGVTLASVAAAVGPVPGVLSIVIVVPTTIRIIPNPGVFTYSFTIAGVESMELAPTEVIDVPLNPTDVFNLKNYSAAAFNNIPIIRVCDQ